MIVGRIAFFAWASLLAIALLTHAAATDAAAQLPADLYEPGPDPIAPALPGQQVAPSPELQGAPAQDAAATEKKKSEKNDLDMLDMDLKQLSQVAVNSPSTSLGMEVSTVTRTESTVGRSPAAVFVITNEMIRRSGVTCIPEALRMVPGLHVARADSHTWVITARGFSDRFANKLLVLVDGRTVYTPLFSGVYWDVQDVLLEDVERIEVIRGPGATVWGANAVNGVINIITKKAQQTQGTLVSAGGGSHDRTVNGVRVGGNNGQGLYWRAYGKQFERAPGYLPTGSHDDWRIGRGGFRVDWELDRCHANELTVQGDYYGGNEGLQLYDVDPASPTFLGIVTPDELVAGSNVLARWTHVTDENSDWALQTYYDRTLRNQPMLRQAIDTFDVDFQHRFPLGTRHGVIWGLEFRQVHDNLAFNPAAVSFSPRERTVNTSSGFVQDEITLVDDQFFFIAGTKLEHNDYTGFEYQPSGRLLWTPDDRHSFWGAVSRAVRVPSRIEQDGYYMLYPTLIDPAPVYLFPQYRGNRDMISEDMLAYELGYRAQATERFSYDVALFYNVYDNLLSFRAGPWESYGSNSIMPMNLGNGMNGETYGVELSAEWAVTERWRISPCYSFLRMQLHCPSRRQVEGTEGNSPQNMAYLRSYWDLPRNWQFDLALRYVDELPTMDIPSYITMDARLGWTANKNLAFALVGRNLLDQYHYEYGQDTFTFVPSEVSREVFAQIVWSR